MPILPLLCGLQALETEPAACESANRNYNYGPETDWYDLQRKTIVLLGAQGIGRRHIKNSLIARHPDQVAYPLPHTSRPQRADEENGLFYFTTREEMYRDITDGKYLEFGTVGKELIGTKMDTIRSVISGGRVAIVDMEVESLGHLTTKEFAPCVVFIAPTISGVGDGGYLPEIMRESAWMMTKYGHCFDLILMKHDFEYTISQLEAILAHMRTAPGPPPLPPCRCTMLPRCESRQAQKHTHEESPSNDDAQNNKKMRFN